MKSPSPVENSSAWKLNQYEIFRTAKKWNLSAFQERYKRSRCLLK